MSRDINSKNQITVRTEIECRSYSCANELLDTRTNVLSRWNFFSNSLGYSLRENWKVILREGENSSLHQSSLLYNPSIYTTCKYVLKLSCCIWNSFVLLQFFTILRSSKSWMKYLQTITILQLYYFFLIDKEATAHIWIHYLLCWIIIEDSKWWPNDISRKVVVL
jgi:hypothetical protein